MLELFSLAVVLIGYTVLGLTGFGSALVIVPLLAWHWPLPEVVALVLMLDLPASLMHSGLNWRQVQWTELRKLLPGMVLGTLMGLWLTHYLHSRWPLLALGVYVAAVGLRALRAGPTHRGVHERWGLVYGRASAWSKCFLALQARWSWPGSRAVCPIRSRCAPASRW